MVEEYYEINVIVGLDPTIYNGLYCTDSRVKHGNDISRLILKS